MTRNRIRALLYAKDCERLARFYCDALDMTLARSDAEHARLNMRGFELIVHQLPPAIADAKTIDTPPVPRSGGAIRLDFAVDDIGRSRAAAQALGGGIDAAPPPWAGPETNFYLGFDPEGNVFGVSRQPFDD